MTAARVAGVAYILSIVIVVTVNFAIHERLIARGDPAITAQNILTHERLFRVGIAGDLFYCVLTLAVAAALYIILEPVNRGVAIFAAVARAVLVLMWMSMTLSLFVALRFLHAKGIETQTAQTLAKLYLNNRFDDYYVGLLFMGLAATLCAYLFWKSSYVPRVVAVFGIVACAWAVFCTIVFIIDPAFNSVVNLWWFDSALAIYELVLSGWLLFKGIRTSSRS